MRRKGRLSGLRTSASRFSSENICQAKKAFSSYSIIGPYRIARGNARRPNAHAPTFQTEHRETIIAVVNADPVVTGGKMPRSLVRINAASARYGQVSQPREPPLQLPEEPGVNLSTHRAPFASTENTPRPHQWTTRPGWLRFTRASPWLALVWEPRKRMYFRMAQRMMARSRSSATGWTPQPRKRQEYLIHPCTRRAAI